MSLCSPLTLRRPLWAVTRCDKHMTPCPMPHAPCPMPHAPCPMPHAPCPMPHAPCPLRPGIHGPTHVRAAAGVVSLGDECQGRISVHAGAVAVRQDLPPRTPRAVRLEGRGRRGRGKGSWGKPEGRGRGKSSGTGPAGQRRVALDARRRRRSRRRAVWAVVTRILGTISSLWRGSGGGGAREGRALTSMAPPRAPGRAWDTQRRLPCCIMMI
jgi:hypothetical protein